jgi:hypothetical protein
VERSFSHKKVHVPGRLMILIHDGGDWSAPRNEELQDNHRIGLLSILSY